MWMKKPLSNSNFCACTKPMKLTLLCFIFALMCDAACIPKVWERDREYFMSYPNPISNIFTIREETITTVVKNPRTKRKLSPARPSTGYAPSYSPGSEFATPEPIYVSKIRQPGLRHDIESMGKAALPSFFVTDPKERQGVAARSITVETTLEEQQPKWVEVEEIIEFNVKKPTQIPRKRGASPVRSEKDEFASGYAWPGTRPKHSSEDDPNMNNSNNKRVEQAESSVSQEVEVSSDDYQGGPVGTTNESFCMELEGRRPLHESSSQIDSSEASSVGETFEAPGMGIRLNRVEDDVVEDSLASTQDETLPEKKVIIDDPDQGELPDLGNREFKILTRNGKVLTLEDLEDYVPEEGETYKCGRLNSEEDKPYEIAVLQTEINKSTVGTPVLLNVGRPVVSKPRQTFFSTFEGHHPGGTFMSASRVTETQPRDPSNIYFHIGESHGAAAATPTTRTVSEASFKLTPSFCTEVQLPPDNRQSNFKAEVSTRSYSAVGEPVTFCIKKDDPSQS